MLKKTLVCTVALAAIMAAGASLADTKDKKIALSNNYAGNSWRQSMLKSWDKVTKQAVADGEVKQACDAGIIVVSFDGIVTEPCAWRIAFRPTQTDGVYDAYFRHQKIQTIDLNDLTG